MTHNRAGMGISYLSLLLPKVTLLSPYVNKPGGANDWGNGSLYLKETALKTLTVGGTCTITTPAH